MAIFSLLAAAALAAERDTAFEGTWHGTLKVSAQYGTESSVVTSSEVPVLLRIRGHNPWVEFGEWATPRRGSGSRGCSRI